MSFSSIILIMYIKNKNKFSKWEFFLEDPEGNEMRIPAGKKYAKSLDDLYHLIIGQIDQFPEEYMEMIRFNAGKVTLSWRAYMKKVIEHQICIRHHEPSEFCWNDGIGDQLHSLTKKIDVTIKQLPKFMSTPTQLAARAATKLATGKASGDLSGCATCGGTTTFSPDVQNLGRAGHLNVVLSREDSKNTR